MSFRSGFTSSIILLIAALGLCAPGQNAGNEHFVAINNNDSYGDSQGNDYATLLRLDGTKQNPILKQAALLNSGVSSVETGAYVPTVQIVRTGLRTCLYLADSNGPESKDPNEITAFEYPSMKPTGSFSDSAVPSPELGIAIVAHGNYLFAAYNGYQIPSYIGTWQIEPNCTLTLLQNFELPYEPNTFDLAVTPNGNTLIVSTFHTESCCVDSFSIGAGGVLTEHGPYGVGNADSPVGVDITQDSKFALFNVVSFSGEMQVNVFAINSDGSLGTQYAFGGDGTLGKTPAGYYLWLSPDERFLYTDGGNGKVAQVTTLNFTESPLNVTYTGCTTNLKVPKGQRISYPSSMATVGTVGTGSALYVSEVYDVSSVALLAINSTTGCTTEVKSSPTLLSDKNAYIYSLVGWPPRLF
jgi:hypothetical protein